MTLTWPRDMPTTGVMAQSFEPVRVDYLAPESGGRIGGVTAGIPLWAMKLDLANMMHAGDGGDQWRAWLAAQRGGRRQFYGFDIDRQLPKFYGPFGGGVGRPFQPAPGGWAQTIAADGTATLALAGLMPGQIVSVGDYIGFAWGAAGQRTIVRAVEGGVADAAGAVTVTIEPPVPTLVPGTATTTLKRASCLMRLDVANTKLAKSVIGYVASGSAIAAVQDLVA